jgi:hypothetical protein
MKSLPLAGTPGEGQVALIIQQHFQSSVLAKNLGPAGPVEILHEYIQDDNLLFRAAFARRISSIPRV